MTTLHAQPYDISATGFFFESAEEYHTKREQCRNDFGGQVEEFEIQFIDGGEIDCALFKALSVHQGSFEGFLDACEDWSEDQKLRVIIAVGECGFSFDPATDDPDDLDVDIYEMRNLEELAQHFVDEGLLGDIPENLQHYIDYYALSCDLGMDYSETSIAGQNLIYRCS